MKQKSCLSEKFNKVDKLLARISKKKKKKKNNTNIIRNQRATDTMDMKRIIKACYKQSYAHT